MSTGGVQLVVGVFYHRCLGFYLNLGFTLHWESGPGHKWSALVDYLGEVRVGGRREEGGWGCVICRLMQGPYILPMLLTSITQ